MRGNKSQPFSSVWAVECLSFWVKIQFFRKKAGYSQYQLAEKAELSETTIGHLESQADYGLSVVALFRIAKALNVGPDQLLKFD